MVVIGSNGTIVATGAMAMAVTAVVGGGTSVWCGRIHSPGLQV